MSLDNDKISAEEICQKDIFYEDKVGIVAANKEEEEVNKDKEEEEGIANKEEDDPCRCSCFAFSFKDFFSNLFGDKKCSDIANKESESNKGNGEDTCREIPECQEHPYSKDCKLYGQDYEELKRSLVSSSSLFHDSKFPPSNTSLSFTEPGEKISWLRPHQLCDLPQLFVDGAGRFDVVQGELGDCWLLAAMSSLAMDHTILHQVIPPGQGFGEELQYVGMFRFRFWQYGEWVEVVVDDYLPCIDGKLAFIHSESKNEFWSALLEKAYAKLHGSYAALKGGTTCEAMVDFSGGCSEIFNLDGRQPTDLLTILLKAYERKSMNGCSIKPDPEAYEAKTSLGLIRGHAYTITKVTKQVSGLSAQHNIMQVVKAVIQTDRMKGVIPLIRVRNPWGNETEWQGIWADGSEEWKYIPQQEKESLGITFEDDGEWWMSYKDFVDQFDQVEMCNLSPETMVDIAHEGMKWCVNQWTGEWVAGKTAGGCRNFLETFITNPQYIVTLEDADDDDDDDLCTLIVSLMQKGRRALKLKGVDLLSIGFVIYKLNSAEECMIPLGEEFFKYTLSTARSKSFINTREVTARFKLPAGCYVIVPSTYDPGMDGQFLIRTFSEKPIDSV